MKERSCARDGGLRALLSTCADWCVSCNAENGFGRGDILVERRDREFGFAVEIKEVRDRDRLDDACAAALRQIEEKDYTERLRRFGVEKIRVYGIAFCEKRCRVAAELMEP